MPGAGRQTGDGRVIAPPEIASLFGSAKIVVMANGSKNSDDVQFIADEIIRFQKLSDADRIAYFKKHRFEALCSLPHPNGGSIICGQAAHDKFYEIAERFVASPPQLKAQTNLTGFVTSLKKTFSDFFVSQQRKIEPASADKMVSTAFKATSRAFEEITHYVPCVLFYSTKIKRFQVGPVTFYRRKHFLEKLRAELKLLPKNITARKLAQIAEQIKMGWSADQFVSAERAEDDARNLIAGALRHYRKFRWVAEVKIAKCDVDVSKEKALFAIRGALNLLKLLLGGEHTDRIRIAADHGPADESAELTRREDQQLDVSRGWSGGDNVIGDEWITLLLSRGAASCQNGGTVIQHSITLGATPHLSSRFMDALTWYGDAVSETTPSAKIVKFVSAIERAVGTGKESSPGGAGKGVTDIVVTRASILHAFATESDLSQSQDIMGRIYDCRSKLVHGSISPFDDKVRKLVYTTQEATRIILLQALIEFSGLGLGDTKLKEKDLKKHYHGIVDSVFPVVEEDYSI